MHKDHKYKKATIADIQSRELRQPKRVDPRARERFKARPYQLECAEMMKGEKKDDVRS